MTKSSLLIIGCLFLSTVGSAQTYFTAGGLRLGSSWGLTLQQRLADKLTAEVILNSSFSGKETLLTVIPEWHHSILTKRLNIYTGVGLHTGSRTLETDAKIATYGITAIGGAELTFAKLVLSWDIKPVLHLRGRDNPLGINSAVSVRYVFIKNKVYKDLTKSKKKKQKARAKRKRKCQKAKGKR